MNQRSNKNDLYQWQGKNPQGIRDNGEIEAPSAKVARLLLRKQGIRVTRLSKKRSPLFSNNRITNKDVVLFTRQLATMTDAGIPIAQSLDAVGTGTQKLAMQKLTTDVRSSVEGGENLTNALKQHPRHFTDLYTGLVNVGEQSGTLGGVLKQLASYLEKTAAIRRKVVSAMAYPAVVLLISMAILSFLLIAIVPQFKQLFANQNAALPPLTQVVINASEFLQSHWLVTFALLVAIGIIGVLSYRQIPAFRLFIDKLLLNLPIFGNLVRESVLARVSRTIAIMFQAGIPMVDTLSAVSAASGNEVYAQELKRCRKEVATGRTLSSTMKDTNAFPGMVLQMTHTGEETGELDRMLNITADYYEDEVSNKVDLLQSLIEPILVVILGLVIAVVVVAMYLPIFKMSAIL